MIDQQAIPILEEIHGLEWTSFIRYVVEVSRPPVLDQEDQKALALCQDLYRDIDRNVRAIEDLLREADVAIGEWSWPLHYTSYNYLRPRYLLRPVLEKLGAQHREVEGKSAALEGLGWETAKEVLETVLRRERSGIERLEKAVAESAEETAATPKVKGTSAGRW